MTTALTKALAVHGARDTLGREELEERAHELAAYGLFSARHIRAITGLPHALTEKIVDNATRKGGRFNAEMLPLIYDFWIGYSQFGTKDIRLLKTILGQGVSLTFLSKLVDIPTSTMVYWLDMEQD